MAAVRKDKHTQHVLLVVHHCQPARTSKGADQNQNCPLQTMREKEYNDDESRHFHRKATILLLISRKKGGEECGHRPMVRTKEHKLHFPFPFFFSGWSLCAKVSPNEIVQHTHTHTLTRKVSKRHNVSTKKISKPKKGKDDTSTIRASGSCDKRKWQGEGERRVHAHSPHPQ